MDAGGKQTMPDITGWSRPVKQVYKATKPVFSTYQGNISEVFEITDVSFWNEIHKLRNPQKKKLLPQIILDRLKCKIF